ncbi:MAG: hypothetical protein L3J05_04630 [Robiginitomaculum sp.]|nr:hypothetical protein [Robiginitomaculum sp.]
MADNIIGGDGTNKGRQSAHCGEPFGFQEFTNYMFRIWSNYIVCIACQEDNYLARSEKNGLNVISFFAAVLIGILFFLGINFAFGMATYDPIDGSYYISYMLVAIGIFGGIGFAKYAMATLRWMTGTLMKKDPYL